MRPKPALLLLLALAFLLPTLAHAQIPVTNPSSVSYTPSADDAVVTKYELGYFFDNGAVPFQMASLGRPTCQATCSQPLPAHPFFAN